MCVYVCIATLTNVSIAPHVCLDTVAGALGPARVQYCLLNTPPAYGGATLMVRVTHECL